jgi:hypothetical protein
MLKKKLLTIAGVVGILACGACFLPPIHTGPPTPLPPPPIHLPEDIHTVRVVVTDNSVPAHIDTQALANSVAAYINLIDRGQGASAHADDEPGDSELEIKIANGDASLENVLPDGTESWTFHFTFAVVLVRSNGRIVSQKPNMQVEFQLMLPPKHPADIWSIGDVRQACAAHFELDATKGIIF